jgi:hypothetical protein
MVYLNTSKGMGQPRAQSLMNKKIRDCSVSDASPQPFQSQNGTITENNYMTDKQTKDEIIRRSM